MLVLRFRGFVVSETGQPEKPEKNLKLFLHLTDVHTRRRTKMESTIKKKTCVQLSSTVEADTPQYKRDTPDRRWCISAVCRASRVCGLRTCASV
jgi:hypothetical protein